MRRDDIVEKLKSFPKEMDYKQLISDNSKIPGEIKYTKKEMEDLNEEYGKAVVRVNNRVYKKIKPYLKDQI